MPTPRGFVHGGLSPESIVISAKGRAKIPAFELAAQSGFDHEGREARLHDYESPEEASGETPDDRSDIYSVGAILYEMLTTRRPHASRRVGAERVQSQGPERDRCRRPQGARAESGQPLSERGGVLPASCGRRSAVLDALGVAGEEEELAHTSSTSLGRVLAMAGVMLLVVAVLAWWFWKVLMARRLRSASARRGRHCRSDELRIAPSRSANVERAST